MYLKQSVYFITLLSIYFQVNTLFYQLFKIPDRSDTNFWTNLTSIRGHSTNVGRDCSVNTIQDFLWELGRKPHNASRGNHHFFTISFFRVKNQNFAIFEEVLDDFGRFDICEKIPISTICICLLNVLSDQKNLERYLINRFNFCGSDLIKLVQYGSNLIRLDFSPRGRTLTGLFRPNQSSLRCRHPKFP